MMGTYFLWRFGICLITVLAFSLLITFYKHASKIIHRIEAKECEY